MLITRSRSFLRAAYGARYGLHMDVDSSHTHTVPAVPEFQSQAYDAAAGLFRAAGDPERLRLLHQLSGGERCVSDLAASAGVTMSTVSQRLRVLRAEGMVTRRRAGKHMYYRIADDHVADLIRNALDHATHD